MTMLDPDLQSIQDVRIALREAKHAQKLLERMSQEEIDAIVTSMAESAEMEAQRLAAIACEETGFGRVEDKTSKNLFVARDVYAAIIGMKTVGIVHRDEAVKVWEVAQPVGIVAGIIPSTNPTSTVIFKSLIAVKARNAIVFSPHPSAVQCCVETAKAMIRAAEKAGAPAGIIHCLSQPTLAATRELMSHKLTDMILATGGTAMVKAAYSSGKPALGVGPGNVPVYIHSSAKIKEAARRIIQSKAFDYGTICASEQALIADQAIKDTLIGELKSQGAYFLSPSEKDKVARIIMTGNGLNPAIVGKPPQTLAEMAGITVPADTRVLIAEEESVGKDVPFSIEKLSPILALYTVHNWQEGCAKCIELLELGGLGHTLGIHCEELSVIEAFGLEKPASRIVVNTGTTFGGIGATTGIFPSMTLGCGSYGNNITSDNIGPRHLLNIKRVAFGIREMNQGVSETGRGPVDTMNNRSGISRKEVEEIVKKVLAEMKS